jgi:hypothetical protein
MIYLSIRYRTAAPIQFVDSVRAYLIHKDTLLLNQVDYNYRSMGLVSEIIGRIFIKLFKECEYASWNTKRLGESPTHWTE